jgi:hypothetical protein
MAVYCLLRFTFNHGLVLSFLFIFFKRGITVFPSFFLTSFFPLSFTVVIAPPTMKKSHLLLSIVLVLIGISAQSADMSWFRTSTREWKKSGKTEFLQGRLPAAVLDSLDVIYEKSPHAYLFYEKGQDLFVVVSCTFDLYRIDKGRLEKQYRYFNRGYNCGANEFARDGQHYLLGGHGFWMNQMDLLAFDEIHGSWEWIKTTNQPMDYHSDRVYQNSKGIFSLFGGVYNPRTEVDGLEYQGYFLEWKTKAWQKLEVHIDGVDMADYVKNAGAYFTESQDYVLLASTIGKPNVGWNIIEKETGRIFYFSSRNVDMGLSPYLEISGNILTYQAPSGDMRTLDLDAIKAKSALVGEVRLLGPAATPSVFDQLPLYLIVCVGLGGLLIWVLLARRTKGGSAPVPTTMEDAPVSKASPIEVLLPFSGQLLTTEQLDQLLGIDQQANFDSKRMKRARLINEVNEQHFANTGKELIERDKKPEDRRYVYYKIQA